jgi:hypothetical protein
LSCNGVSYDNVLVLKYDKVLVLLVHEVMVIYWYCVNIPQDLVHEVMVIYWYCANIPQDHWLIKDGEKVVMGQSKKKGKR